MASKLSSLTSTKGSGRFMPALLTRMSKGGAVADARRSTAATSVTSIGERLCRAAVGADGRDGAVELGRPAGGKHDMSALRGQRGGSCQADAASGARSPAPGGRRGENPALSAAPVNVYSAAVA